MTALSWPPDSPQECQAADEVGGTRGSSACEKRWCNWNFPRWNNSERHTFLLGWLVSQSVEKASTMLRLDPAGKNFIIFTLVKAGVLVRQSWIAAPDCFPNLVPVQAGGQPTQPPGLWHVSTWALTFAKVAVQKVKVNNFCLDKCNFCQPWKSSFTRAKNGVNWKLNETHYPVRPGLYFLLFVSFLAHRRFQINIYASFSREDVWIFFLFEKKLLSVSTMPPKDRGVSVKPPHNYCIMNSSSLKVKITKETF